MIIFGLVTEHCSTASMCALITFCLRYFNIYVYCILSLHLGILGYVEAVIFETVILCNSFANKSQSGKASIGLRYTYFLLNCCC